LHETRSAAPECSQSAPPRLKLPAQFSAVLPKKSCFGLKKKGLHQLNYL